MMMEAYVNTEVVKLPIGGLKIEPGKFNLTLIGTEVEGLLKVQMILDKDVVQLLSPKLNPRGFKKKVKITRLSESEMKEAFVIMEFKGVSLTTIKQYLDFHNQLGKTELKASLKEVAKIKNK